MAEHDVDTNSTELSLTTHSPSSAPHDLHVVGIGASAGGIEALQTFFDNLSPTPGIAYVVIQHLSPHFRSLMVEILSKHTEVPVQAIESDMPIEANQIYVAPPGKNISVFRGRLFTTIQDRSTGFWFPIDSFLESLADDFGEKSIGVILSGTGSDGTHGGRLLKEAGGLFVVQDPETAKFDGMPRSAINTGLVDQILSPEEIPVMLMNYVNYPRSFVEEFEEQQHPEQLLDGVERILSIIKKKFRLDFSNYKLATIVRRIEHRMSVNLIPTYDEYAHSLLESERELNGLYRELLIGVTRFFRDPEAYEALKRQVIPKLFDIAETRPTNAIRVWIAGCSTGEEAYSMAILLQDYAQKFKQRYFDIKVFATDIDMHAITTASAGSYPLSIASDVPTEYLDRFFVKEDKQYRVIREIRQKVIFAPQDLINNAPFSRIDLACCRNVLIYFKPEIQVHVLKKIAYSLSPSGFLFLGSSENLGEVGKFFTNLNPPHKLFKYHSENRPMVVPSFASNSPAYTQKAPAPSKPEITPAKKSRLHSTIINLFADIMGGFLPDSVIIDKNSNVLYSFGDISMYITMPIGHVDMNLTNLAIPPLRTTISAAVHEAISSHEKTIYTDVSVILGDQKLTLNIIVQPNTTNGQYDWYLVIFDNGRKEAIKEGDEISNFDIDKQTLNRIQDLENRLEFTEENLQATIEELETSNEELQATNEELMAANEELQSTNEELHSTNEELVTVNNEYHAKIKEMSSMNDDMENILRCSEISTIFLDKELKIRRFSSGSSHFVRLTASDIGRPFAHFSHVTGEINLLKLASTVLSSDQQVDKELETEAGLTYLIRVYPYLSHLNQCEGVVITFIDITALKKSERDLEHAIHESSEALEALKQTEDQLAKLVEVRRNAVVYCRSLTGEKKLTYISSNVKDLFGYTTNEFLEDPRFWVDHIHPDDSDKAMKYFERLSPKPGLTPLEFRFKCRDGSYKWLRDETKLIIDDEARSRERLGSWIDITLDKTPQN